AIGGARFLPGKTLLKLGYSLDLARDQDRVINQQAGTALVGDIHAFALQVIANGRRHMDLEAGGEDHFAVTPRVRVDEERQPQPAIALKEPFKPPMMVHVTMRDDDCA